MGLHRDGTALRLSVFETEMRRRLWWQLIILDSWNGRLSGSGSALTFPHMDTKLPLNVNDSDLYPDMKEIPKEHSGATEMIFCLMRYEVGHFFLRKITASSPFDGHWSTFSNLSKSLAEKDQALDEMERILEQKYLRHCDKSIPLHLATLFVAKAASCAMRLEAHHPRQYSSQERRYRRMRRTVFSHYV
jgi:Fungal specific transcription factor domain.